MVESSDLPVSQQNEMRMQVPMYYTYVPSVCMCVCACGVVCMIEHVLFCSS